MGSRLAIALTVACFAALLGAQQASACSCAGIDEPLSFKRWDGAVNARLIDVQRTAPDSGRAKYIYSLRRVFKGRHQYDLHRGDRLRIRGYIGGASCGLPRNRERLYGLLLYEWHGRLQANLCTVTSPRKLRRAAGGHKSARRGGRADPLVGKGCAVTAPGGQEVLRSRSAASAR